MPSTLHRIQAWCAHLVHNPHRIRQEKEQPQPTMDGTKPLETQDSFEFPSPQTYVYKQVGDISIEVDVHLPTSPPPTATKKHPIFLFIHGGG